MSIPKASRSVLFRSYPRINVMNTKDNMIIMVSGSIAKKVKGYCPFLHKYKGLKV